MNLLQYRKMNELIALAMPEMPVTPTPQSCAVASMAKEIVLRQDCRGTAACAVCHLSGLGCDYILSTAQIHDGLAVTERHVTTLKGASEGFAG